MNIDGSISFIVENTIEQSNRYQRRLQELATLLNIIHRPLTNNPQLIVEVGDDRYGFTELLILMFEFVQLVAIFPRFNNAETSLREFLTYHGAMLTDLCLAGKLDHLKEVIEFKKIIASEMANS